MNSIGTTKAATTSTASTMVAAAQHPNGAAAAAAAAAAGGYGTVAPPQQKQPPQPQPQPQQQSSYFVSSRSSSTSSSSYGFPPGMATAMATSSARRHLYPSTTSSSTTKGAPPPPPHSHYPSSSRHHGPPSFPPPYYRRVSDVGRPNSCGVFPNEVPSSSAGLYGGGGGGGATYPHSHPSHGLPYHPQYHHHSQQGSYASSSNTNPRRGYPVASGEFDCEPYPMMGATAAPMPLMAPPSMGHPRSQQQPQQHMHHNYAASYAVSRRLPHHTRLPQSNAMQSSRSRPSVPTTLFPTSYNKRITTTTSAIAGGGATSATKGLRPTNKVTTEKKSKGGMPPAHSLLSPTTMSFERILECASLISSASKREMAAKNAAPPTDNDKENTTFTDVPTEKPAPDLVVVPKTAMPSTTAPPTPPVRAAQRQVFLPPGGMELDQHQHSFHLNNFAALPPHPVPYYEQSDFVMEDELHEPEDSNPFDEIENDHALYNKVVTKMALQRQVFEEPPIPDFTVPTTIEHGFFWRDYPALEQVLFDNMSDYYMVSAGQRQSKLQQNFNNKLVARIRKVATEHGWTFQPGFVDKKIRDRVRCFYKTHLQNAKKRLTTLQKHSQSVENRVTLRVFIRSIQCNMSVEESQAIEESRTGGPNHLPKRRFHRATATSSTFTQPLKSGMFGCAAGNALRDVQGDILADLQKAHLGGTTTTTTSAVPSSTSPLSASSSSSLVLQPDLLAI